MRTMIVGLDNHTKRDPRLALSPDVSNGSGERLVQLLQRVDPTYTGGDFLMEFGRTNLYPTRRAPEGRGTAKQDIDAFAYLLLVVAALEVSEVVLLGTRVVATFNRFFEEDLQWLDERVISEPTNHRFWAIPHPSGRNRWYNVDANAQQAGELLYKLRPYLERRATG